MADIPADVRETLLKTEAEILAGGIKLGQYWRASDTGTLWQMDAVNDTVFHLISKQTLDSDEVNTVDPATESMSGTATEVNDALSESVTAISANTESIIAIDGASMKIAEFGGTFAVTEVMFDFDQVTPSDNTDLLDANDTTNIVTLKKQLRYQFQTFISVVTSSNGAKVLTLRVYNNADDTLLSSRTVDINGGNNNAQVFPLDTVFLDNPVDDLEIYFTAQCTDTGVDLVELNTTIITGNGGGGGAGIWDVQGGEIVNVGSRPLNVEVATVGIGDLVVTGTATTYDSTYIDTGNTGTFGSPVLSDGVNTVIKDDTNNYWCIVPGITIVNPVFTTAQYVNFTGSIEGVYSVELGAGTAGNGEIQAGGSGSPAIVANADVVTPVLEITGKMSRRYDFEDSYMVDSIISPETGAAYVLLTNGIPREATPVMGAGKAKQVFRSFFVGGNTSDDPNLATDVANTLFDPTFIPCDTDATGADLGVGGSLQVLKKGRFGEGAITDETADEQIVTARTVKGQLVSQGANAKGWNGTTVTTYGDSITEQDVYQPYLNSLIGFFSMDNQGEAGTRISGGWGRNMSTDARIDDLVDSDLFLIMGGTNDWGNEAIIGSNTNTNIFNMGIEYLPNNRVGWTTGNISPDADYDCSEFYFPIVDGKTYTFENVRDYAFYTSTKIRIDGFSWTSAGINDVVATSLSGTVAFVRCSWYNDPITWSPFPCIYEKDIEDELKPALSLIVSKIQMRFPSAKIMCLGTPFGKNPDNFTDTYGLRNNLGYTTTDYNTALKEASQYIGIPFINVSSKCGVNDTNVPLFTNDDGAWIHWNDAMAKRGADAIAGGLETIGRRSEI